MSCFFTKHFFFQNSFIGKNLFYAVTRMERGEAKKVVFHDPLLYFHLLVMNLLVKLFCQLVFLNTSPFHKKKATHKAVKKKASMVKSSCTT